MTSIKQSIESTTIRKTMLRILPFTFLCYVIAYLDRVNLGFAALEMNADLALTAEVFGLLSGIFFIGYFLFEVPSNMIMHKVGAKVWIARIMITWGIITIGTGFVQSATHLYAARFLLGIAEAGFFPGIILYFTYWFRSKERGRASSSLILALPIGTIIGAPLSTWIMDNIAWSGIAGWRWLFILEGIPAVILGVIALFYLKNRPRDAKWLTDEEKNWLENELDKERQQSLVVNKASKLAMVKDSKVWKLALIYFANYSAMYGLSFFLPSIIKSFSTGSSNMEIGWLTIIPAIVGIPAILFFGWSSDKRNEHKNHLIVSFLIAAAGFIACGFANSTTTLIVAITFAAIGLYGFCGAFFSFMTLFFTETTAPAGIAMVNAFASLGGFIGPMIFGQLAISNGMFLIAALAILACVILLTFKQTGLSGESRNDNIEITTVNQNVNIEKIG
ncbi:ACS family tartrate transporter-like MFS transporter [Psychrobacillus insolitus]|uniref:ACS family tartrate transporter-like MFS transporter n=1 Tax=Psychrobacillus insolitus TaxID=1461 RepID=A0A2W7MCD4_9BACI|nr:MFS transporter [Psychrobacillus insolitus]PZX02892.1 ACS family tartrate transporter-like MFS transporter [Psychrobacillus insolitus]